MTICNMQKRFYAISCSYYNSHTENWDYNRILISKYIIENISGLYFLAFLLKCILCIDILIINLP